MATIGLAAILIAIAIPLYAYKIGSQTGYTDFDVYYRSATRAKALLWQQVYTLSDGASPFRYSPAFLPLFRPFAELSLTHARLAWYSLQLLWFGLGFYFLWKTLASLRRDTTRDPSGRTALAGTAFALLFTLRFCLDTLTIGQVSSLMFLGFCAGLYGFTMRRPWTAGFGLFWPSALKIGPGILYPLLMTEGRRFRLRAVLAPVLSVIALLALSTAYVGSIENARVLWQGWLEIVAKDDEYYDASHYGSQSFKSALLRLAKLGVLTLAQANQAHLTLTILGCLALFLFWAIRKPASLHGRALSYSMGLFAYMWFMPETFKYSLTPVAIPVALLVIAERKTRLTWFALGFGVLTLSLAGKDVVGDWLFFGSQKLSLPLFATLALAAATAQLAWRESRPLRWLWRGAKASAAPIPPWETPPASLGALEVSSLIPVSMDRQGITRPEVLAAIISTHVDLLKQKAPGSHEILLIPFGDLWSETHPTAQLMRSLTKETPEIRLIEPAAQTGRAMALRKAFLGSRGKTILTVQSEQPCEIDFYERALSELKREGLDLVRANRRHPETRFRIPVRHLPQVHGRHRLGLWFNRLVRLLLPITTTDTHSGSWVLTRDLAIQAFALQTDGGFLFDLELALTARAGGYLERDLPVRLYLASEKESHRVIQESLSILRGLPRLALRYRRHFYDPFDRAITLSQGITADDWGLSPGVNRGILALAQAGVIRRVSLMANCPYLEEGLKDLQAVPGIELGLHFNLTYGRPLQPAGATSARLTQDSSSMPGVFLPSPGRLLVHWLRHWLRSDREKLSESVKAELQSQLERVSRAGVKLSYLDGHHHIHLIPGLFPHLASTIRAHGIRQVRLPYDRSLWLSGKASLNLLSLLARRHFVREGFESLPCFYPQMKSFYDQGLFRTQLTRHLRTEVIVHPAEFDDVGTLEFPDTYTTERVTEFQALRMLGFGAQREKS